MKKILLILFFNFLIWSLFAQTTPFSMIFGDSLTTEQGVGVLQLSSGSIIVAGSARVDSIGGSDISIHKFSSNGNLIWQKYYGSVNDDFANGLLKVNETTLAISGLVSDSTFHNDAIIILVDTNGQEIWQEKYVDTIRNSYFKTLNNTTDGHLIASGGIAGANGVGNDSYIAKIDLQGTLLWTSTLRDSSIDIAHATENTDDGGYMVAGDIQRDGGHYNLYAAKLDASGVVVWKKIFENINNGGSQNIIRTTNGNFLITGESWPDTTETYFDLYSIMMKPNGDVIWDSYIGDPFAEAGYRVFEAEPGIFIIGGYGFNFTNNSTDVIVSRIDSMGNEIDRKYFGNQFLDQGFDITPSIDGGFLATGFSTVGADDQYFLVYDKFPPLNPQSIEKKDFQSINVYPNPTAAGEFIHFDQKERIIDWKMTDLNGKMISSFSTSAIHSNFKLPTSISPGYYLLIGKHKNTVYRSKLLISND